jgi:DNA-binding LacI/PurR family transcriptional regulator
VAQRKSGHVTLLDVARACGFSVSTVSIVLSEAPLSQNVAEKTRQQIRSMAQELGYHPDAFARSLRRQRSQTIGILAYDLSDPYCVPLVRGIQEGLQRASYLPLLMDAQTSRGLFDKYLQMILERRAEGVIVIASRDLTGRGVSSVLVDNEAGGAMAMRHLVELGHRRIAVIRGPDEMFDSAPRWRGIQAAAAQAGIVFDDRLVFQLPNIVDPTSGFRGGLDCAQRMLATKLPFTAVLAFDDLTALGVVRGLAAAGKQVPDDCAVLGFDDVLPAEVSTPAITTVRQPLKEMGLLAAEWVLDAIEAREQRREQTVRLHRSPPELVVRMSTAEPPGRTRRSAAGS